MPFGRKRKVKTGTEIDEKYITDWLMELEDWKAVIIKNITALALTTGNRLSSLEKNVAHKKQLCPTCGIYFTRLSSHKCKWDEEK